jgi:hypothetical protein
MAFLYGRGGCLNTKNAGFRPGQVEEVLIEGSTAINFLVWRKSTLIICQFILCLNAFYAGISIFKLTFNESATDADTAAAAGTLDPITYAAETVSDLCNMLCASASETGEGVQSDVDLFSGGCQTVCKFVRDAITGGAVACTGSTVSEATLEQPTDSIKADMEHSQTVFAGVSALAKLVASLIAAGAYRLAIRHWADLHRSMKYVQFGWLVVFTQPLLLSFVPWYQLLQISDYQSAAPIDQPKYAILAVQIRAGMGLKLYLSTFQLALALIPGAGHA